MSVGSFLCGVCAGVILASTNLDGYLAPTTIKVCIANSQTVYQCAKAAGILKVLKIQ